MNNTIQYTLQDYRKELISAGDTLDVLLTEIEGTLLSKWIIASDGETFTDDEAIELIKEYLNASKSH